MSAGDRYLLKVLTFVRRREGGGRERREVGGGKRGWARLPQSSAGDSQADQSGPQSITIRLSDVQSDSECSRRGVITVLDGVTLIKAGASRWNEILFCFVLFCTNAAGFTPHARRPRFRFTSFGIGALLHGRYVIDSLCFLADG